MPKVSFNPGDLVWVKLKGFPHWPARIDDIVGNKYKMFYFGTHEKGWQSLSTLSPFHPNRDKFTLYRGSCPKTLIEGVLEAENNPQAKPEDTLSEVDTDAQIWIVMGPQGRNDFAKRYPDRAAKAKTEFEVYTKEMRLQSYNIKDSSASLKARSPSPEPSPEHQKENIAKEKDDDRAISNATDVMLTENTANQNTKSSITTNENKEPRTTTNKNAESSAATNENAIPSTTTNENAEPSSTTNQNAEPSSTTNQNAEPRTTTNENAKVVAVPDSATNQEEVEAASEEQHDQMLSGAPRKRNISSSTTPECEEEPSRKRIRKESITMVPEAPKASISSSNRETLISDLNQCLKYSLRKSYLNRDAAMLILNDIEALNITKDDKIDEIRYSLRLITKLKKLPEIQERCAQILKTLEF